MRRNFAEVFIRQDVGRLELGGEPILVHDRYATSVKVFILLLLFASVRCSSAQTDTGVLAVGEWSESVTDKDHALRGRLVVYDDKVQSSANHARIYLELQHVFQGGWSNAVEIYFNISDGTGGLHFELRDGLGLAIPTEKNYIRGHMPNPYWVTLPCDSTLRLRADTYNTGFLEKPTGLEILVQDGLWIIPANSTTDCFLSASFTPPKDDPSPFNYFLWQGTLKLPGVKIPIPKQ